MTAYQGYGTHRGYVYELDAYGHPAAPDTSPYIGNKIHGIRGFGLTDPPARIITHFDGDSVSQQQTFPPTDPSSGTLNIDGQDLDLSAILGSVNKVTVSGIQMVSAMTDKRGNEPTVGILVYQQAVETLSGDAGWHTRVIPKTTAIRQSGGFGENNYETIYNLAPKSSDAYLWGKLLTTLLDGTAHAGWQEAFSNDPMIVTAWKADGVEVEFPFEADHQAQDTTFDVFWAVAGVVSQITANVTKATSSIEFDYAPDANVVVMVPHRFPSANA
jgi:hypothetical protein